MKKVFAWILCLTLLWACGVPVFAAEKDTTPHAAVELSIVGGLAEIPPSAYEAGFAPSDFAAGAVETVIPVRETLLSAPARDEMARLTSDGLLVAEPEEQTPSLADEDLVGLPSRWVLVLTDPTRENALALAFALNERYVRDALGEAHPLADALLNARVIDYEGSDIYAYGNYLLKVWVNPGSVEKPDRAVFGEDVSGCKTVARLPGRSVCVLWPKDASDFAAAYRTLKSLYRGGVIQDGGVFPTYELTRLLESAEYADFAKPLAGDPDGDCQITAADARAALRSSVGLPNEAVGFALSSDADGDGTVTAADARSLLRMAVGLEDPAVRVRVPALTSGMAVVGPIPGHADGGYVLGVSVDENDPVAAELLFLDTSLPGYAGGTDYSYLILKSRTPGVYRVTLTERRPWEKEPLYTRVLEVDVR